MHILLTGASGRVGPHVARELIEHGHEVRAFDTNPLPADLRSRAEMVFGDITDRLTLMRAATGCDAIAHLAAIPDPTRGEHELIPVNVGGTQNVFAAAEANNITRVICASSCSAFGFAFAREPFDPDYLPVDENHPARPQDLYGLSKLLVEETARTYARRGVNSVCWRYPEALDLNGHRRQWYRRRLQHTPTWRSHDFWAYIAVQDVALAFRLALESDLPGSHVLIAAARDSFAAGDIREAVAEHFPALAAGTAQLHQHASLYSSARAKELLGFEAQHSWRDVPELAEV